MAYEKLVWPRVAINEMTLKYVASLMVVVIVAVTESAALPHSGLEHITLQLQPEMLRGHRLVLTLEPLIVPKMQSNVTSKSLISSHNSASSTSEQNDEITGSPPITTERSAPLITTQVPVTTPETSTEDVVTSTVNPVIPDGPILHADGNVDSLLIKFPDLRCPQGSRPDFRGKCRPTFNRMNLGRSFSGSLSLSHPIFGVLRSQGNSFLKAPQQNDLESANKVK